MDFFKTEIKIPCDECRKPFSLEEGLIVILKDNFLCLCKDCISLLQDGLDLCSNQNHH